MSIKTELERLVQGKEKLKTSISHRGAKVSSDTKIDSLSQLLDSCPFCVKGTFTPGSDTGAFSVSGLNFTPDFVCMYNTELSGNSVNSAVCFASLIKNEASMLRYRTPVGELVLAGIGANSSVIVWDKDGCTVNIPSPENRGYFKAGYTYSYIVTGGME